jgi:hypothetical protein
MGELQHRESMLRAYIQSRPQVAAELIAIAGRNLSQPEYQALEKYLKTADAGKPAAPTDTKRESALLDSACKSLTEHFFSERGRSEAARYSLIELLHIADTARVAGKTESHWNTLNEDLLEGIAWEKMNSPEQGIVRMNTRRIVGNLYGKPLWEVTPRYSIDKKIERVVDLYYLTEREIEGVAYSRHIPCGPKTLQHINSILAAHQLPALHDVVK